MTKDVSAKSSAATDVIPLVIGIKRVLSQLTNDTGLQTMKKEKINDMNTRFADAAAQPLYAVATLVDPRYRGKRFSQSEFATAKQWLVDAVDAVHCRIQLQRVQLQRATTTTAQ